MSQRREEMFRIVSVAAVAVLLAGCGSPLGDAEPLPESAELSYHSMKRPDRIEPLLGTPGKFTMDSGCLKGEILRDGFEAKGAVPAAFYTGGATLRDDAVVVIERGAEEPGMPVGEEVEQLWSVLGYKAVDDVKGLTVPDACGPTTEVLVFSPHTPSS